MLENLFPKFILVLNSRDNSFFQTFMAVQFEMNRSHGLAVSEIASLHRFACSVLTKASSFFQRCVSYRVDVRQGEGVVGGDGSGSAQHAGHVRRHTEHRAQCGAGTEVPAQYSVERTHHCCEWWSGDTSK